MTDVALREIPAVRLLSLEATGSIAGVSRAFTRLYGEAIAMSAAVGGPALTIYHDPPREFTPSDVTFSVCLPLEGELDRLPEGLDVIELPGALAAVALHEGPYESIGPVYDRLLEWCDAEGYSVGSPVREVYVVGPDAEAAGSPADYRTEVQFPIVRE